MHRLALNSWTQVVRGLESGDINAAFINIPLAMDLFERGEDITLLMFTHRAGSRMVCRTGINQLNDFQGKSVLIPHALSVQHMLIHKFLSDKGVRLDDDGAGSASAEAVPPALMSEMVSRDRDLDIAGFICAEPYGQAAVQQDMARHLLTTGDLWKHHPCCAFAVKNHVLASRPEALQTLVTGFFRSAQLLDRQVAAGGPVDASLAQMAADFSTFPKHIVTQALTSSGIRYAPEQLIPDPEALVIIQNYMTEAMGLLSGHTDMDTFVDPVFARTALSELNP